jgi:hypothetical protein
MDLGSVRCHISSDLEAPKRDVELLDLFVAVYCDEFEETILSEDGDDDFMVRGGVPIEHGQTTSMSLDELLCGII